MNFIIKSMFALIFTLFSLSSSAQTQYPYKVVFDITSANPANQKQVVHEVALIKKLNPNAQLEVVIYGHALDMVKKDKSAFTEEIKKLAKQEGISFNVCHIAMDRQHLKKSDLVEGVGVVPDGIYEIISKQKEGWGYIKVAQ